MITYGNLFILRHGETTANSKGYWYNHEDADINETGIEQAVKISEKIKVLNPEVIISSPLKRCVHTAEIVLDRTNPKQFTLNTHLVERNLKSLEGLDTEGIKKKFGIEMDFPTSGKIDHLPDVEPSNLFYERVKRAFDEIIEENKGKRTLVVTHGGVMWAFADIYLGMKTIKTKTFKNCALLGLSMNGEKFVPTISINMREDWYSHINPSWKGLPL
ncbi:histidine phosphatase family protein [Cuniculiplasma sp. SKW3]|uniref:histidine phosphatase family protein n=1 Tax=unclassified Cuniculiplasma TaxID=2619706 RepID=UPI003FD4E02C